MTEISHPHIEQAHELANFVEEIRGRVEEEKKNRKTGHFISYPHFNPEELTAEDADIYQKVQSGTVTRQEYAAYRQSVNASVPIVSGEQRPSRHVFLDFINNMALLAVVGREEAERKRHKTE